MAGFTPNIQGGVDVPQMRAPVGGGSTLGDIASLAKAGAGIYKMVKDQEKAELEVQLENQQNQLILDTNSYKLQLLEDNKGITSYELDNKLNTFIRQRMPGASATQVMGIRQGAADKAFGGSSVGMLMDEERAEIKAVKTYEDGLAKTYGPYSSMEEAVAEKGDGIRDIYKQREADELARKRAHEKRMNELTLEGKEMDVSKKRREEESNFITGELDASMNIGIENVLYQVEQQAQADGIEIGSPEFNKLAIDSLERNKVVLQRQLTSQINSIEDRGVRKLVQDEVEGLFKDYDTIVKPSLDYYNRKGQADWTANEIVKHQNIVRLKIESDPELGFVSALVAAGIADADTLKAYHKGLFGPEARQINLTDNIRQIIAGVRQDPDGSKSMLEPMFNNPATETKEDGTVVEKPDPRLSEAAKVVSQITQDIVSGELEVTDKQKQAAYDSVTGQIMTSSINPNKPGQWVKQVTGIVTNFILDPNYESNVPESTKSIIANDISDYVGTFFGGVKRGHYATELELQITDFEKELRSLGVTGDMPTIGIGVNQTTGLIEVAISSEELVEKAQSVYPFKGTVRQGEQRITTPVDPTKTAAIRSKVKAFKHKIENNKQANDMLKALAKAKNIPLLDATTSIMAMLSKSSNLPIYGEFKDEPEAPKKEEPKQGVEVSALQKQLDELQKQNEMLLSMSPEEFAEFRNA